MSDSAVPDDLHYTAEHEWVQRTGDTVVRVGITDYAQGQLGDVVFVQLPAVGDDVVTGESFAEVESTKSVSDIFGPLDGAVSAVNESLESAPETVNSDAYGAGWLVDITVSSADALDAALGGMLDAAGYRAITED